MSRNLQRRRRRKRHPRKSLRWKRMWIWVDFSISKVKYIQGTIILHTQKEI